MPYRLIFDKGVLPEVIHFPTTPNDLFPREHILHISKCYKKAEVFLDWDHILEHIQAFVSKV